MTRRASFTSSPRRTPSGPDGRLDTYILDGKQVVSCPNLELWEGWIDYPDDRCIVAKTRFPLARVLVKTKFLGVDVAPAPSLGPLVFETKVRGGEMHGYLALYKTWQDAWAGHAEACHLVRETLT